MRAYIAGAVLAALIGSVSPAFADERPEPTAPRVEPLPDPRILLQGVVREEDVALLFEHLRAVLLASSQGRAAPSSPELRQRMDAIGAELRARGTVAGMMLLVALEAAARSAVRESLSEPAPR